MLRATLTMAAVLVLTQLVGADPYSEALKITRDVKQRAEARNPLGELAAAPPAAPADKPADKPAAPPAAASQPADPVDDLMGDYVDSSPSTSGPRLPVANVVAEGKGTYRGLLFLLPKEGQPPEAINVKGKADGGKAHLSDATGAWSADLAGGKLIARKTVTGANSEFNLTRVVKHSKTEGAKPPAGAVALLPYEPGKPTRLDAWTNKNWKVLPDGSVEAFKGSSKTVASFGDCQLHVEFRCPYMPEARGQGRGNSGVYLQDRYEVQVLDSFGLPLADNECGGLYKVAVPKVNACYPPLSWQTYDITFKAPKLDDKGQMTAPAVITVLQNGVLIQGKVEVKAQTGGGQAGAAKLAPIMLQDHGNPVRFRNIWVVELKDAPTP